MDPILFGTFCNTTLNIFRRIIDHVRWTLRYAQEKALIGIRKHTYLHIA